MPSKMPLLKLFLLSLFGAPFLAQAAPVYSITALGSIGGNSSSPSGLNNAGQVVGYAYSGTADNAFISTGGVMSSLHPPGAASSAAWSINMAGVAAGDKTISDTKTRAVTFSGSTVTEIGSLGDANTTSYAFGINDSGQVSGTSYLSGNTGAYRAYRYTAGSMLDIGTLGGTSSLAHGINASGSVVGNAHLLGDGASHAFRYSGDTMTDLGTLGGSSSDAWAINESGVVVGVSWILGDLLTHAFIYSGGTMVDIGGFNESGLDPGSTYAYSINKAGLVVGGSEYADDSDRQHAFLYSSGVMIDLNDLIDPASEWTLEYATAINDHNQITAYGCNRVTCQGFLLTPDAVDPGAVPEPETAGMVLLGLGMLGLARRKVRAKA